MMYPIFVAVLLVSFEAMIMETVIEGDQLTVCANITIPSGGLECAITLNLTTIDGKASKS